MVAYTRFVRRAPCASVLLANELWDGGWAAAGCFSPFPSTAYLTVSNTVR